MVMRRTRLGVGVLLCMFAPGLSVVARQADAQVDERLIGFGADPGIDSESDNAGLETDQEDVVEVSVSPEGRLQLHIQGGDLYAVLQQLLLHTRSNIVFGRDVQGEVSVSLYDVTLAEALSGILRQNGYAYREEGNFIYIYTQDELAQIIAAERKYVTEVLRLNYISPSDASMLLKPFLEGAEAAIFAGPQASSGSIGSGSAVQSFALEDIILVKDYEDNIANIKKRLAEIDRRPKQILVQATILRATLNENNQMGVDFNILGGVDFQRVQGASSVVRHGPNQAGGIGVQAGTGVGTGGGLGGGTGTGVGGVGLGGQQLGDLTFNVPVSQLNDNLYQAATEFAGTVPSGGLSFGVVTDHISVFIRALESVTDVTVVAKPNLLVVNKTTGRILVGSRDGYRGTSTVTTTSEVSEIQYLETGTQIEITPFIANDGFIRMQITPSDSTGSVVEGLPSEDTTELTTNIIIKDGHTILLGGLFREFTSTGESQIPLLGDIPMIGEAFKHSEEITIREEVIILLTVHIVDDAEVYAEHGGRLEEDFERVRVGLRESARGYGRERLAQANYHKALEYATAGEDGKALWHARLAIHNRPTFLNAIKLKEELMQKRAWEDEGSVIKHFLHGLIEQRRGSFETPFGRPALPGDMNFDPYLEPESYEYDREVPGKDSDHVDEIGQAAPAPEVGYFVPAGQAIPPLDPLEDDLDSRD